MEGSSKNSINDWRKTYPPRRQVSEADALKSIQQWLESNEDDVSIESEWETSSEEDETEDENNEGEVKFPPPPPSQFQPDIAASLMEDESTETGAPEDNEVLQNVPIVSRKRGSPSAEAVAHHVIVLNYRIPLYYMLEQSVTITQRKVKLNRS